MFIPGLPSFPSLHSDFFCLFDGLCRDLTRDQRNSATKARWERGAFRRPLDPSRAERRPRDIFCRLRRVGIGLQSSVEKRPCGVRTSHCAARRWFPRISTVQRRCAARTCRIRSARDIPQNFPRRRLSRLALRVSVNFAEALRSVHSNARPLRGSAFRYCAYGSFDFYRDTAGVGRPAKHRRATPAIANAIDVSRSRRSAGDCGCNRRITRPTFGRGLRMQSAHHEADVRPPRDVRFYFFSRQKK